MMTIKNVENMFELTEILKDSATFTEAELGGRITQYNGTAWDSIWIPQDVIDRSRNERGNIGLWDLALELVKADLACIDKIRLDREDVKGYVYTLYQLPTQGYAAQNQGGIRFMSNVEELSELFDNVDGEVIIEDLVSIA